MKGYVSAQAARNRKMRISGFNLVSDFRIPTSAFF